MHEIDTGDKVSNAAVRSDGKGLRRLAQPTVLLADRGRLARLPFDVSGFRVISCDNTIGGKKTLEKKLRKHLKSIVKDPYALP